MPKRKSKEHTRLRSAQPREFYFQRAELEVKSAVWDLDPPKQFVRRYGWLDIIRNYVETCHKDGYEKPWKYLTLPGSNASDIGFLLNEGLLERTSDGRLNVAICDVGKGDAIANKLGAWGGILAFSTKFLHEELESPNSEFNELFPFDVINMDLCDCLYPPKKEDNLKALKWIFLKQRGTRFLLLLTTNPNGLADDELLKVLHQNFTHNRIFQIAYSARFGSGDPARLSIEQRIPFAQILFPKIIARMARPKGYRMQEHFAAHYKRPGGEIIAHSFEFNPVGCEGIAKYESRFDLVPQSEIRQEIQIDFSAEVRREVDEAYDEFIQVSIITRSVPGIFTHAVPG